MKYYQETLAVAQRILLELCRRRRSLIFWSIFPISILLINGLILTERGKISIAKAFEIAAPSTLVGAALFFSCLGGTVATVVAEREQLTLKRLFISPLSGISYFLGIFLAHSCIATGQTILVYTVSAFLGGKIRGSVPLGEIIVLQTSEEENAIARGNKLGFTHRLYGNDLAFWLPERLEIKDLISSFEGIPIASIARHPVRLEHIYVEVISQI